MHKIRFPLGRAYSAPPDPIALFRGPTSKGRGRKLCPRRRWGSLQRSPGPLAIFKGPTSKGKEWMGRRKRGEGKKGEGKRRRRGMEVSGPKYFGVEPHLTTSTGAHPHQHALWLLWIMHEAPASWFRGPSEYSPRLMNCRHRSSGEPCRTRQFTTLTIVRFNPVAQCLFQASFFSGGKSPPPKKTSQLT